MPNDDYTEPQATINERQKQAFSELGNAARAAYGAAIAEQDSLGRLKQTLRGIRRNRRLEMPNEYYPPYSGNITRLVNVLKANGIESRQDLLERFDVDATARQYALLKHVGPVLSELLVWLRGLSIDDWRRYTGMRAFNDSREG